MVPVVSFLNQKGGVGKTTTVIHLSAALARLKHPTLVIDIDPQASASRVLGLTQPEESLFTTAHLFRNNIDDHSVAPWQSSIEEDVSLIPGHIALTRMERELLSVTIPHLVLKKQLQSMALGAFDVVFLDCPPSLSMLTTNALVASSHCLIPFESGSKFSLDGYRDLQRLITDVKDVNPDLEILGALINRHDGRKKLHQSMAEAIARIFGDKTFATRIGHTVKLEETASVKKSIFQHDGTCSAARDFMALGREVVERLGLSETSNGEQEESTI